MIFVSIALLVVAAIGLGVGIASSSVGPLVLSIIATLLAAGTLWASFIHYRKEAAMHGGHVTGLGGNEARQPGYPGAYRAPANPVTDRPSSVPTDWDALAASDAAEVVEAFNLDELHDLRRHEVEHERRTTVLAAIDERIDALVALRRKLSVH